MRSSLLFLVWSIFSTIIPSFADLSLGHSRLITKEGCKERHFVQYGKSCLRVCPPKTHFFDDDNKCYDSCPLMTIQIGENCLNATYCDKQNQVLLNGSCEDECPQATPYRKDGNCYRNCPKNYVQNGTECITVSDCLNNSYIFNNFCVKGCPSNSTYSVHGVCQQTCPNSTVITGNSTECLPLSVCTDKGFVAYNTTCVPLCPPEAPYLAHKECVQTCPKSFVLLNSTNCIQNSECMTKSWYVFNETCVADCPNNTYQYNIENVRMCSFSCPKGFVLHEETCISEFECTSPDRFYGVLYNKSCLLTGCPPGFPLNYNGHCTDTCPYTTFETDTLCIDNSLCTRHFNLEYKGKCVRSCPKEAPMITHRTLNFPKQCVQCSNWKVQDGMSCVTASKCISEQKYVYRRTCYDLCPENTYSFTDFRCYIKCPRDTIANISKCIPRKECQFFVNDSCVSTCPIGRQFVHNKLCLQQCPDNTYDNGTICHDLYTCPTFIYNGTCVAACPESSPFMYDKHCKLQCPTGFKAFKDRNCVLLSKCKKFSNGSIIENNTTCMTTCPHIAPYTYKFKDICLPECPEDTFLRGVECKYNFKCNGLVYKGRCIQSCPSEAPYKHNDECFKDCPENTLLRGVECIYKFDCHGLVYKRRCILSCPSEAPYKHNDECLKDCPEDMFKHGNNCSRKTDCPNVIFNKTCIYKGNCPSEAKYRKDNFCLKKCPDVIDVDGTNCISINKCTKKGYFITEEKTCVASCPLGYGYVQYMCMKQRYVITEIVIVALLTLATYAMLYLLLYNPSKETRNRNGVYTKIENTDDSDDVTGSDGYPRQRRAARELQMEAEERSFFQEDAREGSEATMGVCEENNQHLKLVALNIEEEINQRGNSTEVIIELDELPQRDQISVEVHRQQSRDDGQFIEDHQDNGDSDDDALLYG